MQRDAYLHHGSASSERCGDLIVLPPIETHRYSIYINDEYVCDVSAPNQFLAVLWASYEPAVVEARREMENQTYIIRAFQKTGGLAEGSEHGKKGGMNSSVKDCRGVLEISTT